MNKNLKKFSNGKYEVVDNNTYFRDEELCNFHIKNLTINCIGERKISFTVELKSKDKTEEATIPYCYFNEPSSWLLYGFDDDEFHFNGKKDEFNVCMNEIKRLIVKKGSQSRNLTMGWQLSNTNAELNGVVDKCSFHKYENLNEEIYCDKEKKKNLSPNYILDFSSLVEKRISLTLFSYMLVSILSSFDLLGENKRPSFVVAITGGKEVDRRKTALFFTNLYQRSLYWGINAYRGFHITRQDSFPEIRFKTEYAKDCVLIAFEPSTVQMKFLVNDIYRNSNIDEENTVRNMCLLTTPEITGLSQDIIEIKLSNDYSFEVVEEFFKNNRNVLYNDDHLINNVYYFVKRLLIKINKDKDYVLNTFKMILGTKLKRKRFYY